MCAKFVPQGDLDLKGVYGISNVKDNSTADTAYVPMVLFGTDETPPTASNFPLGTIYIQYTE